MRRYILRKSVFVTLPLLGLLSIQMPAQSQRPGPDAEAWWSQTTALAQDSMEGRDTGTPAYERAAQYVAAQFARYGLKPAGDRADFFQTVPMHQVDLDTAKSSAEIIDGDTGASPQPLVFLHQITLSPHDGTPESLEGPMVFVGARQSEALVPGSLRGKIAVYLSTVPGNIPEDQRQIFLARRMHSMNLSGATAIFAIDDPFAIEPFHWPAAYARTVTLAASGLSQDAPTPTLLRVSTEAAPLLFAGSSHSFSDLIQLISTQKPLPTFQLARSVRLKLIIHSREITSRNILAILPGSDSSLGKEYLALSAHLDGYGFGTPVQGDALYNGALDDAAYVATLLELASSLHARAPKRSLLFCIFTGEEKGLLGSAWFTTHPTVPISSVVADLNLDQLRPIFPLKILTMEGLTDSTLGGTVQAVARGFGIQVRPDLEPQRNLFRRADNYNFVRVGVPIASFIFGYDPGSPEESIYRDWYARRYHKPQDDLSTPIDWTAAVTFNRFFQKLVLAVGNAPEKPHWLPSSPYAPKQSDPRQ